ncbi:hypothetical protein WJX72_004494 [[Myrmecia] bisecta]|uniref:Fungal-type protein kinase domain-containing protein n=1 Tax=[Myrmecia] bisecta TaxID=41462 RepID=A0AAW1P9L5_9CHLO
MADPLKQAEQALAQADPLKQAQQALVQAALARVEHQVALLTGVIQTLKASAGVGEDRVSYAVRLAEQAYDMGLSNKRRRSTVTTVVEDGRVIIDNAVIDQVHFERHLADYKVNVATWILNSQPGIQLRTNWPQATQEEHVQRCLNILFPILLKNNPSTNAQYFDTSETHRSGLDGNTLRIDCTVADRNARCMPHVATFAEVNFNAYAHQIEVVGEAWRRVVYMQDSQEQCDFWWAAVIGQNHIQLWDFPAARSGDAPCKGAKCTPLTSLQMSADSPGFQLLVRWLCTPFPDQGFIPPELPADIWAVVAKVPATEDLADREVQNLGNSAGSKAWWSIVCILFTAVVPGWGALSDSLEGAGYLHADLSYYNLLLKDGKPLLADMQTLLSKAEASHGGRTTGTPLFMALDVMKHGKHSIGTELETVLYLIIFILGKGVVTWCHTAADDHLATSIRAGAMTVDFQDKVLARVPSSCHQWLTRLRNLFFSNNSYDPSVTCAQFLEACYLDL